MERTSKGIPTSLRPFFQEYRLEDIDPDEYPSTVIERTLQWGNRDEIRWLFARYGRERLIDWIRQAGWRRLSRHVLAVWSLYFDLQDLPQRRSIWPH